MPISDPLRVVKKATETLEKLDIPYLVGGSLASSLYGIPRATQDVDIVADLSGVNIDKLVELLEPDFYIDKEMVKDCVLGRNTFNIIDKEELYKLDIFMQGQDDLSATEMSRRVKYTIAETGDQSIYLCSPEDIIAHKLYWFKLGGHVSERQWNDASNVVKVQKGTLDLDYLKNTCMARGVSHLLGKMFEQEEK